MHVKKDTNSFASYRIFEMLKFLSLNSADIDGMIKHMESIDPESKSYSVATIYKYLTTLKTMGFEILKNQNKFYIENLPFKFDFTKEEIRAIKLIQKIVPNIAEKNLKTDIKNMIGQLMPKLSAEMKDYFDKTIVNDIKIPRKFSDKEIDFINKFEKYMDDDLKLCIKYSNDKNEQIKLCVEPVEIEYKGKNVFFTVFESTKGNIISVQLEKIIELSQLPQKSHKNFVPTTTTFVIKEKLIRRYMFKRGEKSIGMDINGNLIVLNQKEDKNKLMKRLLGYGALCEIISPKVQRAEMIEELDEMLKNYK